ncbi:MAG TPA: phosphotransferase [Candidatus Kryptonia bacterium]|nr:phosphotransferase [Candidatus Kryptonia bacterium]
MAVTDFFDLPIDRQIELARRVAVNALQHYDLSEPSEITLLKHRENSVFLVTAAESDRRAVLRVHRTGYQTAASIVSEFQWMEALNASGIHTPGVIPARDGSLVVSAASDELSEPRLCDMLEWIEGSPPQEQDLVASFRLLGELHARCHAQASQWRLPAGFYRQTWDEASLLDALHPIITPAWENEALSLPQHDLVLACREPLRRRLRQWGKASDRYGVIHADLMPENLIVASDGIRLIDFDDCGFGWYLYDPASALLFYYGQDFYPDLIVAWATGYRGVRPLSDAEIDELPTFLLLRCFYGLGWLQTRRNSEAAQLFTAPLISLTESLGQAFLSRP